MATKAQTQQAAFALWEQTTRSGFRHSADARLNCAWNCLARKSSFTLAVKFQCVEFGSIYNFYTAESFTDCPETTHYKCRFSHWNCSNIFCLFFP